MYAEAKAIAETTTTASLNTIFVSTNNAITLSVRPASKDKKSIIILQWALFYAHFHLLIHDSRRPDFKGHPFQSQSNC